MKEEIYVKGAKENNLKNIDVHIPRNTLTVFTGLSGSGKSTLAFDTIFAEGQRRYIESLSSYARQFLGQMENHRRRTYRRTFARNLNRPENNLAQSALDSWHGDGNLRLFPLAFRARRCSALP